MAQGGRPPPVAIFWDYENVRISTDFPASRVVEDLRALALSHGSLSSFKAYMDTNYERGYVMSTMRAQLQTSGVTICDTPHDNRKEVADVMIITDMLLFGLTSSVPPVVILVSGDRGFAYPLSVLRNNRCKIVLVTTPNASSTFLSSANEIMDFRLELLKLGPPKPREQRKVIASSSSTTTHSRKGGISQAVFASTSRMPVARLPTAPPAYDQAVATIPLTSRQRSRATVSTTQVTESSKGKAKARAPPIQVPTSPTVLELSDDDEDEDYAGSRPLKAPYSNRSPTFTSLDEDEPLSPIPPTSKPLVSRHVARSSPNPLFVVDSVGKRQRSEEEDFDSMLRSGNHEKVGSKIVKKRVVKDEVELGKKDKKVKKRRTSSSSGKKMKRVVSDDEEEGEDENDCSVLILSDDE